MSKIIPFCATNPRTVITCLQNTEAILIGQIRSVAVELGLELLEAYDLEMALAYFAESPSPIVVQFPRFGPVATTFLEAVGCPSIQTPVVVIIGLNSVEDAVRFMRNGAFECVGPDSSTEELFEIMRSAMDHCSVRPKPEVALEKEPWRRSFIGKSPEHEQVANVIRLVAPRRCTVLISGETGTGKELVAKAIHQASDRCRRPMVSVNCSALPENLIEAELFGHLKGAFTGAVGNRIGRFEQADGGTLFLDEIGEFPIHLQAKLLRVLQERELQRLGGTETIKVNVRVIAATNVDLPKKIKQGLFREDLYYRLNVIPIRIPALRDRVTDIPLLVTHFVHKTCAAEGLPAKSVSAGAMNSACAYSWPGNVRQLENIVEQAVVMNADQDSLVASDFSFPAHHAERTHMITIPSETLPDEGMDFPEILRKFERGILDQALSRTQGNRTLAAEMLRLPRTTLVNKLRALESVA